MKKIITIKDKIKQNNNWKFVIKKINKQNDERQGLKQEESKM